MGRFGVWELVIIVILVVVIFGGRKLPELGKGLGQGLSNFRQAMRDQAPPANPSAAPPAGTEATERAEGDRT